MPSSSLHSVAPRCIRALKGTADGGRYASPDQVRTSAMSATDSRFGTGTDNPDRTLSTAVSRCSGAECCEGCHGDTVGSSVGGGTERGHDEVRCRRGSAGDVYSARNGLQPCGGLLQHAFIAAQFRFGRDPPVVACFENGVKLPAEVILLLVYCPLRRVGGQSADLPASRRSAFRRPSDQTVFAGSSRTEARRQTSARAVSQCRR